jgi:hypothetical protein
VGVRGSILATRSVYVPFVDRLEPANRRIAALMAASEPGSDPAHSAAAREAWHLELLARDEAPAVGFTLLALAGLAGWLGGAAWFAWRGVDDDDRLRGRVAARAGLLVILGLVVWMLGLFAA